MTKVQKKIKSPLLSQLPEDFSMFGSYVHKYEHLTTQLAAEYDASVTANKVADSAIYYLDYVLNWQQDYQKADEIIQFTQAYFTQNASYYTAIFLRQKAIFTAMHVHDYKSAIELLTQAHSFFEKTHYKAEIFKTQTLFAQYHFETDARAEALHALGVAQRLVETVASPEYLTSYYAIAAQLNFEAKHYKDALYYLSYAKNNMAHSYYQARHMDILFDCLAIECWIELGEKEKAGAALKALKKSYQSLYISCSNAFAAELLRIQAKFAIMRYEIFSAVDQAKQAVDILEKQSSSQNNLYYIKALETACDAYCLVGMEEEAKAMCERLIKHMSKLAAFPNESLRIKRAKNILESLS